ncbi:hypothetical protein MASR2M15_28000 [Anaerolineales bacterium]
MSYKVACVQLDTSLKQAREIMANHQVTHLPVLDEKGQLAGIISDRDCKMAMNSPFIMRERWQDEELDQHLKIESIAIEEPLTIGPDENLKVAIEYMLKEHIGCLPVLESEKLIGIITRTDILKAFLSLEDI